MTSGVRLGVAAVTTRGFKEEDMKILGDIIANAVKNSENEQELEKLKIQVKTLLNKYPLY